MKNEPLKQTLISHWFSPDDGAMTRRHNVLVVDDEPSGFAVIQALLGREGYDLFYVASGQEALNFLATQQPDTILLDVMMPQINGIETCQQIKSNPDWKHIPILMVTALSAKSDLARCLEAGADDFISKPVNGLELRARVRSLLRIKQQYDALKTTLQLREDMSNMVVHDLRNPITCVLLVSEFLMERKVLQGKDLDRLQRLYKSGRKLNRMVNDLLLLAKMESGQLILNPTCVDLCALIHQVTSEFEEIAGAKQITLETSLPENHCQITADANLLHRLMDNLLSNAVKYSPSKSKVALQVKSFSSQTQSGSPSPQVTIRVSDQGPGIREELRQQIFHKFEIGEAIEGTTQIGLGLTFCKLVAEAHNGQIYVEPNVPRGSIFTVEI